MGKQKQNLSFNALINAILTEAEQEETLRKQKKEETSDQVNLPNPNQSQQLIITTTAIIQPNQSIASTSPKTTTTTSVTSKTNSNSSSSPTLSTLSFKQTSLGALIEEIFNNAEEKLKEGVKSNDENILEKSLNETKNDFLRLIGILDLLYHLIEAMQVTEHRLQLQNQPENQSPKGKKLVQNNQQLEQKLELRKKAQNKLRNAIKSALPKMVEMVIKRVNSMENKKQKILSPLNSPTMSPKIVRSKNSISSNSSSSTSSSCNTSPKEKSNKSSKNTSPLNEEKKVRLLKEKIIIKNDHFDNYSPNEINDKNTSTNTSPSQSTRSSVSENSSTSNNKNSCNSSTVTSPQQPMTQETLNKNESEKQDLKYELEKKNLLTINISKENKTNENTTAQKNKPIVIVSPMLNQLNPICEDFYDTKTTIETQKKLLEITHFMLFKNDISQNYLNQNNLNQNNLNQNINQSIFSRPCNTYANTFYKNRSDLIKFINDISDTAQNIYWQSNQASTEKINKTENFPEEITKKTKNNLPKLSYSFNDKSQPFTPTTQSIISDGFKENCLLEKINNAITSIEKSTQSPKKDSINEAINLAKRTLLNTESFANKLSAPYAKDKERKLFLITSFHNLAKVRKDLTQLKQSILVEEKNINNTKNIKNNNVNLNELSTSQNGKQSNPLPDKAPVILIQEQITAITERITCMLEAVTEQLKNEDKIKKKTFKQDLTKNIGILYCKEEILNIQELHKAQHLTQNDLETWKYHLEQAQKTLENLGLQKNIKEEHVTTEDNVLFSLKPQSFLNSNNPKLQQNLQQSNSKPISFLRINENNLISLKKKCSYKIASDDPEAAWVCINHKINKITALLKSPRILINTFSDNTDDVFKLVKIKQKIETRMNEGSYICPKSTANKTPTSANNNVEKIKKSQNLNLNNLEKSTKLIAPSPDNKQIENNTCSTILTPPKNILKNKNTINANNTEKNMRQLEVKNIPETKNMVSNVVTMEDINTLQKLANEKPEGLQKTLLIKIIKHLKNIAPQNNKKTTNKPEDLDKSNTINVPPSENIINKKTSSTPIKININKNFNNHNTTDESEPYFPEKSFKSKLLYRSKKILTTNFPNMGITQNILGEPKGEPSKLIEEKKLEKEYENTDKIIKIDKIDECFIDEFFHEKKIIKKIDRYLKIPQQLQELFEKDASLKIQELHLIQKSIQNAYNYCYKNQEFKNKVVNKISLKTLLQNEIEKIEKGNAPASEDSNKQKSEAPEKEKEIKEKEITKEGNKQDEIKKIEFTTQKYKEYEEYENFFKKKYLQRRLNKITIAEEEITKLTQDIEKADIEKLPVVLKIYKDILDKKLDIQKKYPLSCKDTIIKLKNTANRIGQALTKQLLFNTQKKIDNINIDLYWGSEYEANILFLKKFLENPFTPQEQEAIKTFFPAPLYPTFSANSMIMQKAKNKLITIQDNKKLFIKKYESEILNIELSIENTWTNIKNKIYYKKPFGPTMKNIMEYININKIGLCSSMSELSTLSTCSEQLQKVYSEELESNGANQEIQKSCDTTNKLEKLKIKAQKYHEELTTMLNEMPTVEKIENLLNQEEILRDSKNNKITNSRELHEILDKYTKIKDEISSINEKLVKIFDIPLPEDIQERLKRFDVKKYKEFEINTVEEIGSIWQQIKNNLLKLAKHNLPFFNQLAADNLAETSKEEIIKKLRELLKKTFILNNEEHAKKISSMLHLDFPNIEDYLLKNVVPPAYVKNNGLVNSKSFDKYKLHDFLNDFEVDMDVCKKNINLILQLLTKFETESLKFPTAPVGTQQALEDYSELVELLFKLKNRFIEFKPKTQNPKITDDDWLKKTKLSDKILKMYEKRTSLIDNIKPHCQVIFSKSDDISLELNERKKIIEEINYVENLDIFKNKLPLLSAMFPRTTSNKNNIEKKQPDINQKETTQNEIPQLEKLQAFLCFTPKLPSDAAKNHTTLLNAVQGTLEKIEQQLENVNMLGTNLSSSANNLRSWSLNKQLNKTYKEKIKTLKTFKKYYEDFLETFYDNENKNIETITITKNIKRQNQLKIPQKSECNELNNLNNCQKSTEIKKIENMSALEGKIKKLEEDTKKLEKKILNEATEEVQIEEKIHEQPVTKPKEEIDEIKILTKPKKLNTIFYEQIMNICSNTKVQYASILNSIKLLQESMNEECRTQNIDKMINALKNIKNIILSDDIFIAQFANFISIQEMNKFGEKILALKTIKKILERDTLKNNNSQLKVGIFTRDKFDKNTQIKNKNEQIKKDLKTLKHRILKKIAETCSKNSNKNIQEQKSLLMHSLIEQLNKESEYNDANVSSIDNCNCENSSGNSVVNYGILDFELSEFKQKLDNNQKVKYYSQQMSQVIWYIKSTINIVEKNLSKKTSLKTSNDLQNYVAKKIVKQIGNLKNKGYCPNNLFTLPPCFNDTNNYFIERLRKMMKDAKNDSIGQNIDPKKTEEIIQSLQELKSLVMSNDFKRKFPTFISDIEITELEEKIDIMQKNISSNSNKASNKAKTENANKNGNNGQKEKDGEYEEDSELNELKQEINEMKENVETLNHSYNVLFGETSFLISIASQPALASIQNNQSTSNQNQSLGSIIEKPLLSTPIQQNFSDTKNTNTFFKNATKSLNLNQQGSIQDNKNNLNLNELLPNKNFNNAQNINNSNNKNGSDISSKNSSDISNKDNNISNMTLNNRVTLFPFQKSLKEMTYQFEQQLSVSKELFNPVQIDSNPSPKK